MLACKNCAIGQDYATTLIQNGVQQTLSTISVTTYMSIVLRFVAFVFFFLLLNKLFKRISWSTRYISGLCIRACVSTAVCTSTLRRTIQRTGPGSGVIIIEQRLAFIRMYWSTVTSTSDFELQAREINHVSWFCTYSLVTLCDHISWTLQPMDIELVLLGQIFISLNWQIYE